MVATTIAKKPKMSYSLDDKKRLCEAWKKSNLSGNKFRRQHGLPSSFHEWCNKLLPKSSLDKSIKSKSSIKSNEEWLQIASSNVLHQEQHIGQEPTEFGLIYNGLKLSFCMPMCQIVIFVKELCNATTVIR